MLDVIEVKILNNYTLFLRFENGECGEVDISKLISFTGVFEKLKDKKYFSTVYVNEESGTICWENGADISPKYLYEHLQKKSK